MHRAIHPNRTAASLRRWLCAWLALLSVVQLAGSAWAGVRGLHRHVPTWQAAAAPQPALLVRWEHRREPGAQDAGATHRLLHDSGQVHQHGNDDLSALTLGSDLGTEALAQVALAHAPGRDGSTGWLATRACHVWAATDPWAASSRSVAPLLKPPRC
jgi:hypothetical protein